MDIQKEREAFEKHASKFFITNEAFEDDGENYVYDEVKFMWDCWLAAKAQAVPEGFVLVNVESLALHAQSIRMFNNGDEEDDYYEIENHVCAIEAMIEAQEQTHD